MLIERSLDRLESEPLGETLDRISYNAKHHYWDMIVREHSKVELSGTIWIDEMTFYAKRYGFDPS